MVDQVQKDMISDTELVGKILQFTMTVLIALGALHVVLKQQ